MRRHVFLVLAALLALTFGRVIPLERADAVTRDPSLCLAASKNSDAPDACMVSNSPGVDAEAGAHKGLARRQNDNRPSDNTAQTTQTSAPTQTDDNNSNTPTHSAPTRSGRESSRTEEASSTPTPQSTSSSDSSAPSSTSADSAAPSSSSSAPSSTDSASSSSPSSTSSTDSATSSTATSSSSSSQTSSMTSSTSSAPTSSHSSKPSSGGGIGAGGVAAATVLSVFAAAGFGFVLFRVIQRAQAARKKKRAEGRPSSYTTVPLTEEADPMASHRGSVGEDTERQSTMFGSTRGFSFSQETQQQDTAYHGHSQGVYSRPNQTYIALHDVSSRASFNPGSAVTTPYETPYDPYTSHSHGSQHGSPPAPVATYTDRRNVRNSVVSATSSNSSQDENQGDRRSQVLRSHPLDAGMPPTSVQTPQGSTARRSGRF